MREFEFMDAVANDLREGTFAADIRGASQAKLKTRMAVLSYGYGARTQSTLLDCFPEFVAEVGPTVWHDVGAKFSRENACKEEYLENLPHRFFECIKNLELGEQSRGCLEKDMAHRQSRNLAFLESDAIANLEQLQSVQSLRLQPSVVLLSQMALVVSRNRLRFFRESASAVEIKVLQALKSKPLTLLEISENFNLTEQLSQFFVKAITNSWLCKATQGRQ